MNREGHLLRHDLQLVEFLRQVKKLHVEVEVEVESINALLDIEDVFGLLGGCVDFSDVILPLLDVVFLASHESLLEVVSNLLKFSSLMEILPVGTEHILNSLHVDAQSPLNLLGPNDLVRNVGEASDSVQHRRLVMLLVLVVQQLVSEHFNIFFHLYQELNLIFLDSSSDSGASEKSIENLENAEHLIGVLGLRELSLQDGGYLRLHLVNLDVVSPLRLIPEVKSLLADVEDIDAIERLIGLVDLAESYVLEVLLVA